MDPIQPHSENSYNAVRILPAGRYCINHPNIELGDEVDVQTQQLIFVDPSVMLSGGVIMHLTGCVYLVLF